MGVMFGCVQSLGSVDSFNACLKKALSAGASSMVVSFKNLAGTQSGPDALLGFKSRSSFFDSFGCYCQFIYGWESVSL